MKPRTTAISWALGGSLAILATGLVAVAQPATDSMPKAFGGKEDVAFAMKLWSALRAAKMVGPDRINVQPFQGNEPHGSIQQVLDGKVSVAKRSGRVIVKVNHMAKDIKSVYAEPNKAIGAYTVMFKKPAGYDPENKDWFWVKYRHDGEIDSDKGMLLAGRVAKGMADGCIACHRAIGGDDLEILK